MDQNQSNFLIFSETPLPIVDNHHVDMEMAQLKSSSIFFGICIFPESWICRRGTDSCNSCISCKMTISACILRALKIVLYFNE